MIDLSEEQILAGLRAGKRLVIDRRDSPTLPTVLRMEREGKVKTTLRQHDEQSSDLLVELPDR